MDLEGGLGARLWTANFWPRDFFAGKGCTQPQKSQVEPEELQVLYHMMEKLSKCVTKEHLLAHIATLESLN